MKGPTAVFLLLALLGLWLFGRGGKREISIRRDPLTAQPRPIIGTTTDRPALIDIDINGGRTTFTREGPTANGRFLTFPGRDAINGNGGTATARPTRIISTPTITTPRPTIGASAARSIISTARATSVAPVTNAPTRPPTTVRFVLFPGADRIQ